MKKEAIVLVSNTTMPSKKIGSWITRIGYVMERHQPFDYVLSPTGGQPFQIHAKKRKFLSYNQLFRKPMLRYWVARDYIKAIQKISKKHQQLTVVVMDDPHLLAAISYEKAKFKSRIHLIYSFHGFRLAIAPAVLENVDRVLFLSEAGKQATLDYFGNFKPETTVVWNGVDSKRFYPLNISEKNEKRLEYGFTPSDKILIWMANDRPLKGFHLLKEMSAQLLEKHADLKILTIGTKQQINHSRVQHMGRLAHQEIPPYLQIGDLYVFTSLYEEGFGLSMVEAYKCGNAVVASHKGAIPNVLEKLPNTQTVKNPEAISEWISGIEQCLLALPQQPLSKETAAAVWSYTDWESRFLDAIGFAQQ